jgi:anhydro-N-acetylmuramic acid kinase
MLIDAVVRMVTKGREQFDRDGRMAARGALCERLLRRLQGHSYFARRPPKSTGREMFGEGYARRLVESYENRKVSRPDLIHTLTRLTAWSIADAYRRYLPRMPEEVILCGGGADNPVLVGMLGEELRAGAMLSGHSSRRSRNEGRDAPPSMAHVRLRRIDELGIPNKAKEAACFALLAAATLDGVPGNLPGVTGARRRVVLGEVADPRVRRGGG